MIPFSVPNVAVKGYNKNFMAGPPEFSMNEFDCNFYYWYTAFDYFNRSLNTVNTIFCTLYQLFARFLSLCTVYDIFASWIFANSNFELKSTILRYWNRAETLLLSPLTYIWSSAQLTNPAGWKVWVQTEWNFVVVVVAKAGRNFVILLN